ncbi:hypothetical protein [Streptomyces sp. NBC_00401]|uniref:hypothetical protein n=1 Tax=Streptomyces sp. NBC_00401 TaxID=2975738 RepID=UPI0022567D5D|nr:hypothetical protein [Streptomyces sp. NBC_00401]MCX5085487.1 hypothetical protein [Streptomyces sp. NBC_00401]
MLTALPEHAEEMVWDVPAAAAADPWGFAQWDASDPEGKDVRIASVGQLLSRAHVLSASHNVTGAPVERLTIRVSTSDERPDGAHFSLTGGSGRNIRVARHRPMPSVKLAPPYKVPTFTEGRTARTNRERLVRTLTFWLRPAFALRVINRFQKIAGFDRSMALASSALTALVPVAILYGAVLNDFVRYDSAGRIIKRYRLTGAGAEAVNSLFSPVESADVSVGIFGVVFLTISVLSFARASQRLFEQTWELKPLSVRNTRNGLWWILTLGGYAVVTGWFSAVLGGSGRGLVTAAGQASVTTVFLVWSGWILSAKRITWPDLIPFGLTAAVLTAGYSLGAMLYLPRLFNASVSRYGVVGAVFAMISALFAAMLVLVVSAALGREVRDELSRIRQGQRPSDHEVRQQWDSVVEQTRARWRTAREQVSHRRVKGADR